MVVDPKQKMKDHMASKEMQVLKVRVSSLYSNSKRVFFYENTDDIETYKIWISRINNSLDYYPYPLKNKDQCLKFYDYLHMQNDDANSYFFVDHDFDGSKGSLNRNNLFVSKRYSIENYLFDPEMIVSYLKAEFKCYEVEDHDKIQKLRLYYENNVINFLKEIKMVNFHIFIHSRLNKEFKIELDHKMIKRFFDIGVEEFSMSCDLRDVSNQFLTTEYTITQNDIENHEEDFNNLNAIESYRGKFIYFFFKEWLNKLKSIQNDKSSPLKYFNTKNAKFDPNAVDLYKYANYCPMPSELTTFLAKVA